MRILALSAVVMLLAGCDHLFPSRAMHNCETASHALRVHDNRIDTARNAGAMGFTATLATRGYMTYHCTLTANNQVACVNAASPRVIPNSAEVQRLIRQRNAIEARVARACQV
jgi:hypothetical protein